MTERVALLIDTSYQIYRACAAHPDLMSVEGVYTGGLYGFLQSFGLQVRETKATHAVLCCDSKPYLRSRDYPQYKQIRKKSADEDLIRRYKETEPLVHDLMRAMGVPVWSVPGFEADDLAAHVVAHHRSRYDHIYSASNDSDLYQLFYCRTFAVFRDQLHNVENWRTLNNRGYLPEQWMLSSALQGTHNDIEGIPGVGEKTAMKILCDPDVLMRRYRESHGDIIDRNLRLIKLPHDEFPRGEPVPRGISGFDERALYRHLGRYDIECTLQMVNAFAQLSKGTHDENARYVFARRR